jgi:putative aldouronate transport system permease protein
MKKKRRREIKSPGDMVFDVLNYTVFGLFALLCVFPFYYIFINTISDNRLVSAGLIRFVPRGIHFRNYIDVLKLSTIPNAAFISVSRTVLSTVFMTCGTSWMAYVVSRRELWHRKFVYRYYIATMYVSAGLIPSFLLMKSLGLTNNYLAYVLGFVSAYNMILIKTYIESIPASLEESAEIDGAGYLVRFTRIIFPLSKPILATCAVWTAVGQWNAFMDTRILMQDSRLYTLQYILWVYMNEAELLAKQMEAAMQAGLDPAMLLTPAAVKMAIAMIVTLPVLFVYPFFQRYFVKGIMIGAVKG